MINNGFINELYDEEIQSKDKFDFQLEISQLSESDQELLQEMYFSKKDLQDPKTIEKIEKLLNRTIYDTVYACMITILFLLPVVIAIVVNPALITIGLIGSFTLTLTTLFYTFDLINNMPQKVFDKNYEKFKTKVTKLKEKTQEKLDKEKNPKYIAKYKEIISNCDKVLKAIQDREKKIITKREEEDYNDVKKQYLQVVKFLEYPFDCGWEGEAKIGDILVTMKLLKITEPQFIQRIKKIKFKNYTLEQAIIDWYNDNDIKTIKDAKENYNFDYGNANLKMNVIEIVSNDDNTDYLGQDGKVYSIQTDDKLYVNSFFEEYEYYQEYTKDIPNIEKIIIEVDKELGYYRLSNPPKNVKRKEFPL